VKIHAARICMLAMFLPLTACTYIPTAPIITVRPGAGKSTADFLADNDVCRRYSEDAVRKLVYGSHTAQSNTFENRGSAKSDDNNPVPNTSVDRVEGENLARYGADKKQRHYDASYAHCMYLKGHIVPAIE